MVHNVHKGIPFEECLKENIRNYPLESLVDLGVISVYIKQLEELYGVELTLSKEKTEECRSINICNDIRSYLKVTVTHTTAKSVKEREDAIKNFIEMLESWGTQSYFAKEYGKYLHTEMKKRGLIEDRERQDFLTGALSKTYFTSRLQILDRAEIAPVALIQGNINDWKFVHDHYGLEESDRLISTIAEMLLKHSKKDYLVGRWDGDVFNIVIPMPEDGEAEKYVEEVTREAEQYEDAILAPSIAFGIAYKENVEESLTDKISDAEYEMFNHKLQQKSMAGYQSRLEKGLKNK